MEWILPQNAVVFVLMPQNTDDMADNWYSWGNANWSAGVSFDIEAEN